MIGKFISTVCITVFGLALLGASASAFTFEGGTGTTVYGYQVSEDGDRVMETYTPLVFNLSHDIGKDELAFVANGRMRKDFGIDDSDVNGRVYYGYLQYKGLGKMVRARVGRQYISEGAAVGTVDGVSISVGKSKKWDFTVSGGGKAATDFGKFDFDTAKNSYIYSAHGGVAVPYIPFDVWVGGGFSGGKENGLVDAQTISFEAMEKLTKKIAINQEIHYDLMSKQVDYEYYRISAKPVSNLKLYTSFKHNLARISKTSILSVFANEGNAVLRGGGEVGVNDWLALSAEYSTTLQGSPLKKQGKLGARNDFGYVSLYYAGLVGETTEGFYGAFATADFPDLCPFIEKLGAGTTFRYLNFKTRDELGEQDDETAFFFDVHGKYKPCKFFDSTAGMELLNNRERERDIRAYLRLDVSFNFK
ncbi:MAG: hypothetical protein GY771_10375 [bacterium]|nr:hypothetical protein [bacterium]